MYAIIKNCNLPSCLGTNNWLHNYYMDQIYNEIDEPEKRPLFKVNFYSIFDTRYMSTFILSMIRIKT